MYKHQDKTMIAESEEAIEDALQDVEGYIQRNLMTKDGRHEKFMGPRLKAIRDAKERLSYEFTRMSRWEWIAERIVKIEKEVKEVTRHDWRAEIQEVIREALKQNLTEAIKETLSESVEIMRKMRNDNESNMRSIIENDETRRKELEDSRKENRTEMKKQREEFCISRFQTISPLPTTFYLPSHRLIVLLELDSDYLPCKKYYGVKKIEIGCHR